MNKVLLYALTACLSLNQVKAQECRYMPTETIFSIQEGKRNEQAEHMAHLSDISEEEQPAKSIDDEERISHAANPTTSHFGSYHFFLSISPSGDLIELDDQSIWSVHSSDRSKTLDWLATDTLSLRANHDWFTSYNYRLKNQSTGSGLRVNLSMNPVLHNQRTHWIVAINGSRVTLEDGSVWSMSSWDREITQQWLVNDVLIIGTNDGWFRRTNPNILINTTLLPVAHARGKCQN